MDRKTAIQSMATDLADGSDRGEPPPLIKPKSDEFHAIRLSLTAPILKSRTAHDGAIDVEEFLSISN